jgi:hypothetical protein
LPAKRWKVIPETDKAYSVSDHGEVRRNAKAGNRDRGTRLLKLQDCKDGHVRVPLYHRTGEGASVKLKSHTVARLVAGAFLRKPSAKLAHPVVEHKDGDRHNNRVDNLRWTTRKALLTSAWKARKLHADKHTLVELLLEKGLPNTMIVEQSGVSAGTVRKIKKEKEKRHAEPRASKPSAVPDPAPPARKLRRPPEKRSAV